MIWLVVLAVGAGSYLLRSVPLFVLGRVRPSARLERGLARAGTAALTALTASAVVDAGAAGPAAPTMLAVGVGTLAAVRQASLLGVVALGGAVYLAADLVATTLL